MYGMKMFSKLGVTLCTLAMATIASADSRFLSDSLLAILQGAQVPPTVESVDRALGSVDTDGDGVADATDNCIALANPAQRDTDGDSIGNACDADLNQDCTVNVVDLGILRMVFFSDDANADFNGDGIVNVADLGILRTLFFGTPGPSGLQSACSTTLTLSGRVPGARLDGGSINVVVDGGPNGGVVSFTTTLAMDDSYEASIYAPVDDAFVTLTVDGQSAQAPLRLRTLAGSVDTLSTAGGSDGTVNSDEVTALDLHEVSTALSVLAIERNGGPIRSDEELNASIGSLDGSLLIDLAALLRIYLQMPELVTAAGATDTLALISSAPLRQFLLSIFALQTPGLIADGSIAAAETLRAGYPTSFPGGLLYVTRVGNLNAGVDTAIIDLQSGGIAQYVSGTVSGVGTWSADGDRQVRIAFDPGLVLSDTLVTIEDPANPGVFIETTRRDLLEGLVFDRLIDGVLADHVFMKATQRTTFPDLPAVPDQVRFQEAGRSTAQLVFDGPNTFPLDASDLTSAGQVAAFYHRDNASEGSFDVRRGLDTLDFNNDGTGASRRRGFGFNWLVSPDSLVVTFDNGDVNEFEYVFDDYDGLPSLLVTSTLVGETPIVSRTLMLPRDETQAFSISNIQDRRYRSDLATNTTASQPLDLFDFMFMSGNMACRNPGNASSQWAYSLQDGRVDILRSFDFDPLQFFNRTWEPVQARADGFWVIETLQIDRDTPIVDPGVTPGRLNFYSLEQLLSGNSRPTLVTEQVPYQSAITNRYYFEALFFNDVDPEGDQIVARDVDFVSTNGGTVAPVFSNSGTLLALDYTAPSGFSGIDTVMYRASDLLCFSDPVVVGTLEILVP